MVSESHRVTAQLRRRLAMGYLVTGFFLFGIVGYAAIMQIRGAVISPANVVVEGNIRRVQQQDGGTIAAIYVRNGQRVQPGDLVVRMDDAQARTELAVIQVQLYGQRVRAARLAAERDGLDRVIFPETPTEGGVEREAENIVQVENEFFAARKRANEGEISQLKQRIEQVDQETEALSAQLGAVERQAAVVRDELVGLEALFKGGLTQLSRINPQRLKLAELEGQVGEIKANIARARGRISEINVQIAQVGRRTLNEVARDLREASEKIADLQERRIAAEAKVQRIDVRAPIAGTIHQMSVFTIGGVVAPGETIMQVVPDNEKLLVESRIDPAFIDQVSIGQQALVRFPSFDQRSTPELMGRVVFLSADLEQDQKQQAASYFRARVELDDGEIDKLSDQRVFSGLPAELHVQTRQRTILSYLMKPITDQIARTFRER